MCDVFFFYLGVVLGYFAYIRQRRRQVEDADEGIGDVDSIISEGEVSFYSFMFERLFGNVYLSEIVHVGSDRTLSPIVTK